jgi:hypothetical protein
MIVGASCPVPVPPAGGSVPRLPPRCGRGCTRGCEYELRPVANPNTEVEATSVARAHGFIELEAWNSVPPAVQAYATGQSLLYGKIDTSDNKV